MTEASISRKLLTRVLSVYFVLTFIVTSGQIVAEYYNAKSSIQDELLTIQKTFSGSLTRAVWELNTQQAIIIAEGLVAIPMIKGIRVTDESNQVITQEGEFGEVVELQFEQKNSDGTYMIDSSSLGFFGHNFPLIFEFSGRTTKVGAVTILSNRDVIIDRIEIGIYFLIGNAILKTSFLVFLFTIAFTQLLTTPLNKLAEQIEQFDIDDPESSKLHTDSYERNELTILEEAYNNLVDQLIQNKEELSVAQREIIATNSKLDEHNLTLEQEVARKTSTLSSTMLDMEIQQREMIIQQEQLRAENERRRKMEKSLMASNTELKSSIAELNKAQTRLLEAEKMAALGGLAAEISHEINTPLGVGVTSTSYLSDLLIDLDKSFSNQKLTKKNIEDFIENAGQSITLLTNNLSRSVELISSFKQVAADQTSDKYREINILQYLNEIINSLHPKLKKTKHQIHIDCKDNIHINCHAGALAQIITNLIVNSLIHGFESITNGNINIAVKLEQKTIYFHYQDDGAGIPEDRMSKLFELFYTTKEGKGGTGLGTHIVKNLITQTLHGEITSESKLGEGLSYDFSFPV